GGSITPGLESGTWEFWKDRIHHAVLPAFTLGMLSTAAYTQFLRNAIIQNGQMDYVQSARARGTSETKIDNKHILRNSIIPLITFKGFHLATLIRGAVITETTFTYTGIVTLSIASIDSRDYALVMSVTMIFSLLTIICNLVADLLYGRVDPRIRY